MAAVHPAGWYKGDMHVHRNCGDNTVIVSAESVQKMMAANDLDVVTLLADMGNGEVFSNTDDLPKVNGRDAPQSIPGRIVHWDAEWHWDATYSAYKEQALGGHLILLGLDHAEQIWKESPYKIVEWAKPQGAVKGFAHLQYLGDTLPRELNCCIPVDLPVEAALGGIDFISEDVYSASMLKGHFNSEALINDYYKLLNCGFRLGLAAGTDFPCNGNEPLGELLTYVNVTGKLSYKKWIQGIREGKTVVSRAGNREFLDFRINEQYIPGDEIFINQKTRYPVEVSWYSGKEAGGTIELVRNGKVIFSKKGISRPGSPLTLRTDLYCDSSAWLVARRMNEHEHVSHTAPLYLTLKNGSPFRSKNDALYYIQWIDTLLDNIKPGGSWHHYFPNDLETVGKRYLKARELFTKIYNEAGDGLDTR